MIHILFEIALAISKSTTTCRHTSSHDFQVRASVLFNKNTTASLIIHAIEPQSVHNKIKEKTNIDCLAATFNCFM